MCQLPRHLAICLAAIAVCLPAVAVAEPQVTFNTGAYDKLNDFVRAPNPIVVTENREPVYVLTRFVLDGESGDDWVEALEILNTMRDKEPQTPALWYERFMKEGQAHCASAWSKIDETADSITFERVSDDCPPHGAQHAIYKVMYSDKQVFTLIATRKGEMDAETRGGWLAVMESASVVN